MATVERRFHLAFGARGARHPRPQRVLLTETERRVAELAASGRTNPQIGRELRLSTAAVEQHMIRVYRKLNVTWAATSRAS